MADNDFRFAIPRSELAKPKRRMPRCAKRVICREIEFIQIVPEWDMLSNSHLDFSE